MNEDEWKEECDSFNDTFWDMFGYIHGVENKYEFAKNIEYPVNFVRDLQNGTNNTQNAIILYETDFYNDIFNRCCVYYLREKKKIVYIGITKSLITRIDQHRRGVDGLIKNFDSFCVIYTKNMDDAAIIEGLLVSILKPKYNTQKRNYIKTKISEYMG